METIRYIKENGWTGQEDILELRSAFFKHGVSVSYDDERSPRRVIFSISRAARNGSFNAMQQECNGLILEAGTWRQLVEPIRTPRTHIKNVGSVRSWLRQGLYDVYLANDGTVINLYFFDDQWVISTTRGIEMNKTVFCTLDYATMFEQALASVLPETVPEDFYGGLDTSKSYTFILRHKDVHAFADHDAPALVFVKCAPSDASEESESEQPASNRTVFGGGDGVPQQVRIEEDNLTILFKEAAGALDILCELDKPVYGFVLVSRAPETTGDHSHIIIESSLLRKIRQYWYDGRFMKLAADNNVHRNTAALVDAFISSGNALSCEFLALFPQFTDTFEGYAAREDDLVKDIKAHIAGERKESDRVRYLAGLVTKTITLAKYDDADDKIREIIRVPDNITIYCRLLA